jgi:hypothetical protein
MPSVAHRVFVYERLPTKAFIYIGREDRFGKAFARGPLYETVNERGELDWKAGTS